MHRTTLSIFVSLTFLSSCAADDDLATIPQHVQSHMQSMVGSWTFKGHQGDRKFAGEETIRLVNNDTALLQEGYFDLTNGEKEHYIILSGWDGDQNTVLVRGFTTDGITWAGEWKTIKDGTWHGTASDGPATFEVKRNSMRYEDAGEGTPWISNFTRKQK